MESKEEQLLSLDAEPEYPDNAMVTCILCKPKVMSYDIPVRHIKLIPVIYNAIQDKLAINAENDEWVTPVVDLTTQYQEQELWGYNDIGMEAIFKYMDHISKTTGVERECEACPIPIRCDPWSDNAMGPDYKFMLNLLKNTVNETAIDEHFEKIKKLYTRDHKVDKTWRRRHKLMKTRASRMYDNEEDWRILINLNLMRACTWKLGMRTFTIKFSKIWAYLCSEKFGYQYPGKKSKRGFDHFLDTKYFTNETFLYMSNVKEIKRYVPDEFICDEKEDEKTEPIKSIGNQSDTLFAQFAALPKSEKDKFIQSIAKYSKDAKNENE